MVVVFRSDKSRRFGKVMQVRTAPRRARRAGVLKNNGLEDAVKLAVCSCIEMVSQQV